MSEISMDAKMYPNWAVCWLFVCVGLLKRSFKMFVEVNCSFNVMQS